MAVKKSSNKKYKNNNKNKKRKKKNLNNVKKKNANNNVKKKEVLVEKKVSLNDNTVKDSATNKKENLVLKKDNVILGNANDEKKIEDTILVNDEIGSETRKKRNNYKNIFIVSLIIFGLGLLVMYMPRIKLLGEEEVILSYKDSYVEPGYKGYSFNKDISNKVEVVENINDGFVGEYEVNYYIDLFGIRAKKVRKVKVVDKDSPKIDVYSDVINICPNDKVPEIEYTATDEYDGDITSRVEKIITENEILLYVNDLSNNTTYKSIKIDRVDSVNPVIKLKGDSLIYLSSGKKYSEPGYTVNDNCSNELSDKVKISGNVGSSAGVYKITYEVTDESGNIGSVTRRVIVGNSLKNDGVINNGTIYLTFDDGPNAGTTNKILDILKEEGVKATFFVTCNGPDSLIKRMYDEGHMVALHTATHNYSYIYSSIDNYFNDLKRVSDRVKRITGFESKIIRFPGGSSNTISRNYKKGIMTDLTSLVLSEGYRYYDWNVDGMDASSARSSSDVYFNVISNLNVNRANVVLMHDTKNITVGALRNIIKYGKDNGYKFDKITMDTYMVRHGVNN